MHAGWGARGVARFWDSGSNLVVDERFLCVPCVVVVCWCLAVRVNSWDECGQCRGVGSPNSIRLFLNDRSRVVWTFISCGQLEVKNVCRMFVSLYL